MKLQGHAILQKPPYFWVIMIVTCCVIGCTNLSDCNKNVSFHFIPTVIQYQGAWTEELSAKCCTEWIAKINRKDWTPTKYSSICSVHFIQS